MPMRFWEELGKPGSLIFADENGQVLLTGDQVASAQGRK